MFPLQINISPELWIILLLFVLVSIPVFIGVVVLISKASTSSKDEEIERLKERVEKLESKDE